MELYCKECLICESRKDPGRKPRAPLISNKSGGPFEKVALDILGPLPATKRGNKYILVVSEYFTKWTEAYPIRNHKARTVAGKLVDEFICRYGAPYSIHSDQGREFESRIFKETCKLLGTQKSRTTAYHPQSDGQVERFNRTLLDMLSKHVNEDQKNWDVQIPKVMLAYRSSVNETSGFTPAFLMFGRELRLPADIVYGEAPDTEKFKTNYASKLKGTLHDAYKIVRENLHTAQKRQKDYYDKKVSTTDFKVGDTVLLYNPGCKNRANTKIEETMGRTIYHSEKIV